MKTLGVCTNVQVKQTSAVPLSDKETELHCKSTGSFTYEEKNKAMSFPTINTGNQVLNSATLKKLTQNFNDIGHQKPISNWSL